MTRQDVRPTILVYSFAYMSFTTEGGIRVLPVAKFPKNYKCPVPPNCITPQFATVMDIAPTFLEMAGVKNSVPLYKGREVVGMRG